MGKYDIYTPADVFYFLFDLLDLLDVSRSISMKATVHKRN